MGYCNKETPLTAMVSGYFLCLKAVTTRDARPMSTSVYVNISPYVTTSRPPPPLQGSGQPCRFYRRAHHITPARPLSISAQPGGFLCLFLPACRICCGRIHVHVNQADIMLAIKCHLVTLIVRIMRTSRLHEFWPFIQ